MYFGILLLYTTIMSIDKGFLYIYDNEFTDSFSHNNIIMQYISKYMQTLLAVHY